MKMSEVIKNHIRDSGFIKSVIADKCGIDHQKFYRILSGTQNMTVDEYEMICRKGLGVDPSYFFKIKFSEIEKKQTA